MLTFLDNMVDLEAVPGPSRSGSPDSGTPAPASCMSSSTPRKERLRRIAQRHRSKAHRLRKKLEQASCKAESDPRQSAKCVPLDQLSKDLAGYLSGTTLDFVLCHIRVSQQKSRGQRWTPKEKSLALALYHSSPKSYRLLQKVFKLPSVRTLSRVMQRISVYPGVNDQILEALRRKVVNMSFSVQSLCNCF